MTPTPVTIQARVFDQQACIACGYRVPRISADYVGGAEVYRYANYLALCARCLCRAQVALRITGEPRRPTQPMLPVKKPSRAKGGGQKERRAIYARGGATARGTSRDSGAGEGKSMDQTEILTEAIIASVAQGKRTVEDLKSQLKDGLAYVEDQGVDNVAEEILMALVALDNAIQRIELEHGRLRDN